MPSYSSAPTRAPRDRGGQVAAGWVAAGWVERVLQVGVLGARGGVGREVCRAVEAADDLAVVGP